jgi:hypothetical protein
MQSTPTAAKGTYQETNTGYVFRVASVNKAGTKYKDSGDRIFAVKDCHPFAPVADEDTDYLAFALTTAVEFRCLETLGLLRGVFARESLLEASRRINDGDRAMLRQMVLEVNQK